MHTHTHTFWTLSIFCQLSYKSINRVFNYSYWYFMKIVKHSYWITINGLLTDVIGDVWSLYKATCYTYISTCQFYYLCLWSFARLIPIGVYINIYFFGIPTQPLHKEMSAYSFKGNKYIKSSKTFTHFLNFVNSLLPILVKFDTSRLHPKLR